MNKQKILYKRALVMCTITLICAVILKLVGSSIFTINTNILVLNQLESVVMNSPILSFIYSLLFLSINYFFILGIANKTNVQDTLIMTIKSTPMLIIVMSYHRYLYGSPFIPILDSLCICFMNCLLNKDFSQDRILDTFIISLISFIYQILSIFIRNIGFTYSYYGLVTSLLFMIDYYLLLIISYLYRLKGGE